MAEVPRDREEVHCTLNIESDVAAAHARNIVPPVREVSVVPRAREDVEA